MAHNIVFGISYNICKKIKINMEEKVSYSKYYYLFGKKVRFKNNTKVYHPDLLDKDFCCIGADHNCIALVDWNRRGDYDFDFYTVNPDTEIIVIEDEENNNRSIL